MLSYDTFLLCYGPYPDLHFNIISDLIKQVPERLHQYVHVWCNDVPNETLIKLQFTKFKVYKYSGNLPKYKAMRIMFQDISQHYVVWFDDDVRIDDGWHVDAERVITPDIVYAGYYKRCNDLRDRAPFITKSKWYNSLPWITYNNKPAFEFSPGAYWWLKTDLLRKIDWPDARLSHCGGDTLLGEAVHQAGHKLHIMNNYVQIPKCTRRGVSELQAGLHNYKPVSANFEPDKLSIII